MFPLFPLWLNLIFVLSHMPCDPASENPSASPAHHVVVSLHFLGQSFIFAGNVRPSENSFVVYLLISQDIPWEAPPEAPKKT